MADKVKASEGTYRGTLKRVRNKSRKVRKSVLHVYKEILSCISRSSTVYSYVNVRRQQNETKILFNCCGRIRQSI